MDIATLKQQADLLGLEGEEVSKFVLVQQQIAREDRAKERELKLSEFEAQKAASELEAQRAVSELEAQKAASELEARKLEISSNERIELRRLEVEQEKVKASSSRSIGLGSSYSPHDIVSKPSLPLYREGEDISTYLTRFERIASLLNIDQDTYAVRLASLLTGKCVEIYASLTDEITCD